MHVAEVAQRDDVLPGVHLNCTPWLLCHLASECATAGSFAVRVAALFAGIKGLALAAEGRAVRFKFEDQVAQLVFGELELPAAPLTHDGEVGGSGACL